MRAIDTTPDAISYPGFPFVLYAASNDPNRNKTKSNVPCNNIAGNKIYNNIQSFVDPIV